MSVIAIGPGLSAWAPPPLRGGAALASLYAARADARDVQPRTRIARCGMDVILPRSEPLASIEAREHRDGSRSAWWGGVARCHRLACPVCAAQRARSRAERVRRAVQADVAAGRASQPWQLITLTVPHGRTESLGGTLDRLVAGWRRTRSTRAVRAVWDARVSASIRAIEVTWSPANGWHPHIHLLVRGDLDAADVAVLVEAWCARTGASAEHGVRVSPARPASAVDGRYVAKLANEVGGAGKGDGDTSHWRILRSACEHRGTPAGDRWRARWAEYDAATRGRRMFECDERARALADACPIEVDEPVRSWTIGVWRAELRQLGQAERADREPYTWLVLRAVARGDPEREVQREIDAILGVDEPPELARAG